MDMVHSRQNIADLFLSYVENRGTEEEKEEFIKLFKEPGYESMLKEFLHDYLIKFHDDQEEVLPDDFNKLYEKILIEINHREIIDNEKQLLSKVDRSGKGWRLVLAGTSIAAVFFIAFFLGRISYADHKKPINGITPAVALYQIKVPLG